MASPTTRFEQPWWDSGAMLVAGVDEVGRGALAGPLVAAAVVLPPRFEVAGSTLQGLRDSKVLRPSQREALAECLAVHVAYCAIGSVSAEEIDQLGLTAANRLVMERAVLGLDVLPDVLLIDALTTDLEVPQVGLIDGDALCISIAAASVVAKVTRDLWMARLGGEFDPYGFSCHKGYGTERHLAELAQRGPCSFHRRSFAPVAMAAGRMM